jgi:hypothetical protein
MSGCRRTGSSLGNGLNTICDFEPVSSITFLASCRIANSFGLPTFTGPVTSSAVAISRISASIRSSAPIGLT